jgi:hypothetical protein
MVEYYTQRVSAGLILSEGIPVVPQAVGYANVPGIWSPRQIEAWKLVTDSVHRAGGRIFAVVCGMTTGCKSEGDGWLSKSGTTPGLYNVTVTGTDAAAGTITSSTTVYVTVL